MWHFRAWSGYFGLCTPWFFIEVSCGGYDQVWDRFWDGLHVGCSPDLSKRGTLDFWRHHFDYEPRQECFWWN